MQPEGESELGSENELTPLSKKSMDTYRIYLHENRCSGTSRATQYDVLPAHGSIWPGTPSQLVVPVPTSNPMKDCR